MSRCPLPLSGGRVVGSGGGAGDPSAWAADYDTVGALVVSTPLVDLAVVGSWAMFLGMQAASVVVAGFGVAEFGVNWELPAWVAVGNAVEVFPYGAPLATPVGNAGYQAPALVGAAGYGAVTYAVVGTTIVAQTTGIGGFTVRWALRGRLYTFDGAVRLVA